MVPTDLKRQGKHGKIKWSGKSQEMFLFVQKVMEHFKNAYYLEI